MVIFCCLTNILLITSLISLLSNTLTKVSASGRAARSSKRPTLQAMIKGVLHAGAATIPRRVPVCVSACSVDNARHY
jgi:hypothetical protein